MPIRQIQQISESHCGPAVLQMLLDALGIQTTQEHITRAAGAEATIEADGVRIDQLGLACSRIAPQAQFWYKHNATISDIKYLLQRGYGVGVEWQGLFYDSEEEEDEDADYGHYSVISFVDEELDSLIIVDPYKDFVNQDRIFPISTFLRRWWDTNEVRDMRTGHKYEQTDRQVLFFVTPKDEYFPEEFGFQRFSAQNSLYEKKENNYSRFH